jgi:hypothetical protein
VIGLCVEKLWEAIVSLMDECSPKNYQTSFGLTSRRTLANICGLFRPASRVPHCRGCVACRDVRSKRTKSWGEAGRTEEVTFRFSTFSDAGSDWAR